LRRCVMEIEIKEVAMNMNSPYDWDLDEGGEE
jgi:hypothetical protein